MRTTSKYYEDCYRYFVEHLESRFREYWADRMAYRFGFGKELVSALYLLEKISLGDERSIAQKMVASHPRITARIEKLEYLLEHGDVYYDRVEAR